MPKLRYYFISFSFSVTLGLFAMTFFRYYNNDTNISLRLLFQWNHLKTKVIVLSLGIISFKRNLKVITILAHPLLLCPGYYKFDLEI